MTFKILCLVLFLITYGSCDRICGEGSSDDCSDPPPSSEARSEFQSRALVVIPAPNFLFNQLITFSEVGLGTINPVYPPLLYGGPASGPTVRFGGIFLGQTVVGNVVTGLPSNPLTINLVPQTFTANDGSSASNPILSGTPLFFGPTSFTFSSDVSSVGLDAGFLNGIGATELKVYARNGNLLGAFPNTLTGFQFFGVASTTGANIAGAQYSIIGNEPAGFEIDNVRFFVGTTCLVDGNFLLLNSNPIPNTFIEITPLNNENNTPFFCEKGVTYAQAQTICACFGATLADINFSDIANPAFFSAVGGFQACDGRIISRSFWIRSYQANTYGGVPLVLTVPSVTTQSATSLHGVLCNRP